MADNRLKVEIQPEIDESELNKDFKKIEKQSQITGSRISKNISGAFSNVFGSVQGQVVALATTIGGLFAGREIIEAAAQQEDAVNRLNASLSRIGEFSEEASRDLQNFASSIQQTTRFGDEAVIEQLAFAQSLGATAEQSKVVVEAAADLASALNIDLNSATRNVAKTLGGYAGELGEVIPALKDLTQEQLRAGEGVALLARQFSGFASKEVMTFSGAIDQLKNSFGDLLEEFGFIVTNSPLVVKLFKFINDSISDAIKSLKELRSSGDLLRPVIQNVIDFAQAFNTLLIPLEVFSNAFNFFIDAVAVGINKVIADVASLGGVLGAVLNSLGVDNGLTKFLTTFSDSSREVAEESGRVFTENLLKLPETILDTSLTDASGEFLDSVQSVVDETNDITSKTKLVSPFKDPDTGEPTFGTADDLNLISDFSNAFVDGFTDMGIAIQDGKANLADFTKNFNAFAANTAKGLKNGIGQASGNAFAAFGNALATGENAFAAFGKAFIKQIGAIAVQQGTSFILQGIGYLFVPGFQSLGSSLIAAGAGLATFGGALSGLTGGGSEGATASGGGVTTGGSGIPATQTQELSDIQEEEREAPTTIVANISGPVVGTDRETAGLALVDLLQEAFDNEGVEVRKGSFA